jgi:MoaA/NifB/PqqE/SkfB family radical SAM enzyme
LIGIKQINPDPFLVTWDLGRRCNYDCSYCPAHRHDNFSPHASLSELINTANFIFEYISTIAENRINKDFNISFTGGEPTVNPNFIKFAEYLTAKKKEYTDLNLHLDLTTNGAMSKTIADSVIEHFDYVTVSYHAESNNKLKQQVLDRIRQFHSSDINIKVNVMMHADYFDECKSLCETLQAENIKYIPRAIDREGLSTTAHLYPQEQIDWFSTHWQKDVTKKGRPCCGGRTFGVCTSQGVQESKYVETREFEGWHCSVNWYFLHVEQQTGLIYTHQTCQARLDGTRGAIGSLTAAQDVLRSLRHQLSTGTMPIVVCPNKLCGCGLCTPKHKKRDSLKESLSDVLIDVKLLV